MASHIGWSFFFRMRLMKRAAYIISVSESTRRDIIRHLGVDPERIVTIANGVSQAFNTYSDRQKMAQLVNLLHIQADAKVVLNVSGNSGYKNIQSILRAMNILRQRRLKAVFLRVGEDFSLPEKQLVEELKLSDCVRYVGSPKSDEDLIPFYQLAHVFAFPSLYEGFGWPPVEAMRNGRDSGRSIECRIAARGSGRCCFVGRS